MEKIINKYISAKANDKDGELYVWGDISDDKWFDDDVTPKSVRDALKEMDGVKSLALHINSYGGSVFAGNAIFNVIDSWKKKNKVPVNAYIDGIAASMGSGIAMVADKIYMPENSMMMLHKPLSFAIGNADDMREQADLLDKVEDTLITNYMRHFTGTEDELRQILSDETWFTATEAKEVGLCDEVTDAVEMVASAKGIAKINGVEFNSMPLDKIKEKIKIEEKEEEDLKDKIETVESEATVLDAEKPVDDVSTVVEDKVVVDTYMTAEDVKNALGEDMDATAVLDYAKKGMSVDNKAQEKAKAYDKMVRNAIDKAIANGIKAKGDAFAEDRWRKILNSLDYDEIIAQSDEWESDAKIALNAGKRVSQPIAQADANEPIVNANDYDIFK